MLCGRKIRLSHLLVHPDSGDFAGDIEGGGNLSGRCSHRVMDLVSSTCVADFLSRYMDLFKDSTTTTSALAC
jgi:hypothetical protein